MPPSHTTKKHILGERLGADEEGEVRGLQASHSVLEESRKSVMLAEGREVFIRPLICGTANLLWTGGGLDNTSATDGDAAEPRLPNAPAPNYIVFRNLIAEPGRLAALFGPLILVNVLRALRKEAGHPEA